MGAEGSREDGGPRNILSTGRLTEYLKPQAGQKVNGSNVLPGKLMPRRTGPLFCRKAPFSLISGIEDANSQVSNLPGDFCGGLHFARSEGGS
jgi:hypothetical protein